MKKSEIQIGATYVAKVSGKLANVRIVRDCGTRMDVGVNGMAAGSHTRFPAERHAGWDGINLATKREIHIRGAASLRKKVDADRLTKIREARSAGASYEDARAWVDSNEQRLRDIAADIRAKTETSTS
jgi:hypothetical protein